MARNNAAIKSRAHFHRGIFLMDVVAIVILVRDTLGGCQIFA
jgi:hypothetical protein